MSLENQVAKVLGLDDMEVRHISKHIDEEDLRDLYSNKKFTTYQIADLYGVSRTTICNYLRKYSIPIRSSNERRKFDIDKHTLKTLYVDEKLSASQIAKKFNVNRKTVENRMRDFGIPFRAQGLSRHLAQVNHCILTDKSIEWLDGELLGDGHLEVKSKYSARFTYTSKYEEYIKYISNTLNSFGIKQSGDFTITVIEKIKGKPVKAPYITYGYKSLYYEELLILYKRWYPNNKKAVPEDIELTPLTCRQWYIGDGSLHHPKYGGPSIGLYTNGFTPEDVEFLTLKLKEIGIWATRQPSNNSIYIPVNYVEKFLDYIGECPVECYKYKWEI